MSSSSAPSEADAGGARRILAGLLVLIACQVAAHWALTRAPDSALADVAGLLPLAAVALWVAFRLRTAVGLAVVVLLGGVIVLAHWLPLARRALPLLPQLALCLTLAWLFGSTLRPGRVALVTRLARSVHGTLPLPIVAYTRRVTFAWAAFMLAMAASSLLLFAFAPLAVWSSFANLALLPLAALMFLAEYSYRIVRYPWFAHASIVQSLGAFRRLYGSARSDSRTH